MKNTKKLEEYISKIESGLSKLQEKQELLSKLKNNYESLWEKSDLEIRYSSNTHIYNDPVYMKLIKTHNSITGTSISEQAKKQIYEYTSKKVKEFIKRKLPKKEYNFLLKSEPEQILTQIIKKLSKEESFLEKLIYNTK